MYQKDYKIWHSRKTGINNDKERPNFHEREIWFTFVGENIGFEQDGKGEDFFRPVLVFKKFNNEILWSIPLSKSINKIKKKNSKFYHLFNFTDKVESVALLSQIRLIDGKRLVRKIGTMSSGDFEDVIKKLKGLMP